MTFPFGASARHDGTVTNWDGGENTGPTFSRPRSSLSLTSRPNRSPHVPRRAA